VEVGLELLLLRSGLQKDDAKVAEGKKIVQKLSYLLLAINQVDACISDRTRSLYLFETHYNELKGAISKHTSFIWESRKRPGEDKYETIWSVFTTWKVSFQQITKPHPDSYSFV
jgi:hypothetical protein